MLYLTDLAQLAFFGRSTPKDQVLLCLLVVAQDERVHRTESNIKDYFANEKVNLHEVWEESEMLSEILTDS